MEPTRHSPELKPSVEDLRRHIGAVVSLNGFVEAIRDQKRMQFLILNSHGNGVQISHEKTGEDDSLAGLITELTPGSAATVTGLVKDAPTVRLNGFEIEPLDMVVHSLAGVTTRLAPRRTLAWTKRGQSRRSAYLVRLGSCLGICFRTALWTIAGTPWPNFPLMATMRRSLSSWESRRGLPTPVERRPMGVFTGGSSRRKKLDPLRLAEWRRLGLDPL
jgi:hypothetical protein